MMIPVRIMNSGLKGSWKLYTISAFSVGIIYGSLLCQPFLNSFSSISECSNLEFIMTRSYSSCMFLVGDCCCNARSPIENFSQTDSLVDLLQLLRQSLHCSFGLRLVDESFAIFTTIRSIRGVNQGVYQTAVRASLTYSSRTTLPCMDCLVSPITPLINQIDSSYDQSAYPSLL